VCKCACAAAQSTQCFLPCQALSPRHAHPIRSFFLMCIHVGVQRHCQPNSSAAVRACYHTLKLHAPSDSLLIKCRGPTVNFRSRVTHCRSITSNTL
jgi:hypothetical protein